MVDKYLSLSKDFTGTIADKWTNTSTEQKFVLFGTAAILGTCWGYSKIYFWSVRRKTRQRIEEEREKLKKDKEKLHQELKNDKDLTQVKDKIVKLSFSELHENLRDGKLTAKIVLRAYQLKALEVNPDINAIAHVIPDVQKLAEEYDANQESLLLGGIPVTLKDHYTIKGRYATIGLGSYLFREAREDYVIIKVLKKHGAIPFFITNVPQLLMGVLLSANPIHGQFGNPHDPDRIPGGSSSGEGALLAAGGSILGWGSDIGGSIRAPAHFCGVCGFKPTSSRISLVGSPDFFEGVNLIETSFGPMSRDVDGLVQGMRALWDGYMFDLDPSVVPMTFDEEVYNSKKPLRIGYYIEVEGLPKVSPPCKRAVLMAKQRLESLGHQVVRWDFPGYIEKNNLFGRCLLSNDNLDETKTLMSESEVDQALGFFSQTGRYRILRRLRAVLQTAVSIISGRLIPLEKDKGSIAEWWSLATQIKKHREEVHGAWKQAGIDAVICPTLPIPAYKIKDRHLGLLCFPFYGINNLLNMPTGVVPVTHVNQDDLNALSDLDDNDLGVNEFKQAMDPGSVGLPVTVQVAALMFIIFIQAMDPGSVGLPVTVQVAALTFRDELCLRLMKEIEDLKTH